MKRGSLKINSNCRGDLGGEGSSLGRSVPWPEWSISDPRGEAPPPSATSSSHGRRLHGKISEREEEETKTRG